MRSVDSSCSTNHLVTTSDDYSVALWTYDTKGKLKKVRKYQEHTAFVMQAKFSQKDPNIFATASLDGSVKIWNVSSPSSNISLKDHESGVNSIDFHKSSNLLISGSDDHTIKVWDFQERKCIFTLKEHSEPVTSVFFHPELPYIFSGSEDGQVILWNTNNYKSSQALNYYMQKCWSLSIDHRKPNVVAIGYDEGTLVLKLGGDEVRASLK